MHNCQLYQQPTVQAQRTIAGQAGPRNPDVRVRRGNGREGGEQRVDEGNAQRRIPGTFKRSGPSRSTHTSPRVDNEGSKHHVGQHRSGEATTLFATVSRHMNSEEVETSPPESGEASQTTRGRRFAELFFGTDNSAVQKRLDVGSQARNRRAAFVYGMVGSATNPIVLDD